MDRRAMLPVAYAWWAVDWGLDGQWLSFPLVGLKRWWLPVFQAVHQIAGGTGG